VKLGASGRSCVVGLAFIDVKLSLSLRTRGELPSDASRHRIWWPASQVVGTREPLRAPAGQLEGRATWSCERSWPCMPELMLEDRGDGGDESSTSRGELVSSLAVAMPSWIAHKLHDNLATGRSRRADGWFPISPSN
jgi:hypothetical protein